MCGIGGIFGLDKVENPRKILHEINQTIAHRGPDSEGIYLDEHVGLAHRRLSIIDLSEAGNQPMKSVDGRYILVFNGELYNYQEIKLTLDYPFQTNTDTEVVLAAYQKYGASCLDHFDGMFAFAIWDKEQKELFIARDRLGIKPLYYHFQDNTFTFCSELRGILSTGLADRKVNESGLIDYLRYQTVHAPNTLVENVKMLMPGHFILLSDNEFKKTKYWDVAEVESFTKDLSEAKIEIRDRLKESVKNRMIADVSYGAFLSGGIDSSLVVGLMSEVAEKVVKTFSVTFNEEEFSEAKYARIVSEKFGTDHTEIKLTPNDFLQDIPNALAAMDHPSGDGPNTYVVSRAIKEAGVTMALSGLGGDELFAGYDIFKRIPKLLEQKWLFSFPKGARKLGGSVLKKLKPSVASNKINEILKQDYLEFEYIYPINRQVILDHKIQKLLDAKSNYSNQIFSYLAESIAYGNVGYQLPLLSKISVAEMGTYMQNTLLRDTDQMSMAHALEVRVPFLSHHLVELALSIPDFMKYPTSPKKLLIDSFEDLLPSEIVNRPKMGFTLPWQQWLKSDLKDWAQSNIEALAGNPRFNSKSIHELWNRFLNADSRVTWSRIWYLLVLQEWLSKNNIE